MQQTIGNDSGQCPFVRIVKVSIIGGVHCQRIHFVVLGITMNAITHFQNE